MILRLPKHAGTTARPVTRRRTWKFTFEHIRDHAFPRRQGGLRADRGGWSCGNDRDVLFRYRFPTNLNAVTALGKVAILPEHYWRGSRQQRNDHREAPLSSGPYRVGRFELGKFIEFRARRRLLGPGISASPKAATTWTSCASRCSAMRRLQREALRKGAHRRIRRRQRGTVGHGLRPAGTGAGPLGTARPRLLRVHGHHPRPRLQPDEAEVSGRARARSPDARVRLRVDQRCAQLWCLRATGELLPRHIPEGRRAADARRTRAAGPVSGAAARAGVRRTAVRRERDGAAARPAGLDPGASAIGRSGVGRNGTDASSTRRVSPSRSSSWSPGRREHSCPTLRGSNSSGSSRASACWRRRST